MCVCVLCAMHGGVIIAQLRAPLGMMREVCVCAMHCGVCMQAFIASISPLIPAKLAMLHTHTHKRIV